MVDLIDSELVKDGHTPHENYSTELGRYDRVNNDVYQAILHNYGDWNTGWYFPELRKNTEQYIDKRGSVRTWLQDLRSRGRKLFLLTNSGDEYSQCLMCFAFGEDWKGIYKELLVISPHQPLYLSELFDLIIYKARKPYFHMLDKPFFGTPSTSLT